MIGRYVRFARRWSRPAVWQTYLQPTSLPEALELLDSHAGNARLVAGGTDLVVELAPKPQPGLTVIDLTAIPGLAEIREEDGIVRLGALTTHNAVLRSAACRERSLPLAQACWEVGAPQLRTRATVAGNLVTASPANDTISALIALDASLTLVSVLSERTVPLAEFYTGARRTVLRPNELVREIRFPALRDNQKGIFLKLGLRRAQAISVVHLAIVLEFDAARVTSARIALGSVAPTIVRAGAAEGFLVDKELTPDVSIEAGRIASGDASPIDDLRGSAAYRSMTLANLATHGLMRIAAGTMANGFPTRPVLLETPTAHPHRVEPFAGTIRTTINGRPWDLPHAAGKTLLAALREDAGLTGAKEGCAEGECGACTVWLNGQAVLGCLVPAGQAHGASVTTVEGLADGDELHPLQQAFVDHGAVQCGFCIPGCIMAGGKLLQELPAPDVETARIALSGNICRCTGYRKIVDAVLAAAGAEAAS